MSLKLGGTGLNGNKLKCIIGIHGHWKNQNPGGRFGATSQTALPIQLIWPIFLVDRLNWQYCLAKTAPRILIFSMAMGADYSFELIFNETCAPQFNGHNNSFLASVEGKQPEGCSYSSLWLFTVRFIQAREGERVVQTLPGFVSYEVVAFATHLSTSAFVVAKSQ